MPTTKSRIIVTLEPEMDRVIAILAKRQGKSVSKTAALLLAKAVMLEEDMLLAELAQARVDESDGEYLSHEDVW